MKIAYTFHGHSRTWDKCYKNFFENIYSVMPGDIFIHTWDKVNPKAGSHWNNWQALSKEAYSIARSDVDTLGILNAYNPKVFILEQDKDPDTTKWNEYIRETPYDSSRIKINKGNNLPQGALALLGVKNMLESSRKVFEIVKNYGNYDRVFDTRMDITYSNKIDISEICSSNLIVSLGGAYDVWMCGTLEQMDVKTNYFKYIDEYWYSNSNFLNINYENTLKKYLIDKNIWGKVKSSSLQTHIIRPF